MFFCVGYLEYNRTKILSFQREEDAERWLELEHTVTISKLISLVHSLEQNFRGLVTYKFQLNKFASK